MSLRCIFTKNGWYPKNFNTEHRTNLNLQYIMMALTFFFEFFAVTFCSYTQTSVDSSSDKEIPQTYLQMNKFHFWQTNFFLNRRRRVIVVQILCFLLQNCDHEQSPMPKGDMYKSSQVSLEHVKLFWGKCSFQARYYVLCFNSCFQPRLRTIS